ncbi:MAG: zf-HC2 domain-containing protein [Candidatus Sumerlaeia bacterium]|nr:zf-HC2 domain-containing protein [Candidatus Sumerlaeia bacterium]
MTGCDKYKDWFDDYLDGVLTDEKAVELKHHLTACASCRQTLEHLQLIASALKELPVPPTPPELRQKVQDKLTEQQGGSFIARWRGLFTFRRLRLIGEIAALFLILYIGWQIFYSSKARFSVLSEVAHKPEMVKQDHLQIDKKSVPEIETSEFIASEKRLAGVPTAVITAPPAPVTREPSADALRETKDLTESLGTKVKEEVKAIGHLAVKSESAQKLQREKVLRLKIKLQPKVPPSSRTRVRQQTTIEKELLSRDMTYDTGVKAPVKSDEFISEEKPIPSVSEQITTSVLNTIVADLGGKIVSSPSATPPTNSLHLELPGNKLPVFLQRLNSLNYSYEFVSPSTSSPDQIIQLEITW